ncbi:MAG TPA: PfkB family carbohydrate kinase [Candidatus Bathyarchaeia archaeon]|nr:PfkB family carbohydrate kinase [Candidatus Bathyarchaeia archaeon]
MSLLIIGTLNLDTIETPSGRAENEVGGSAAYAALAASFSTAAAVVGIIGHDFPRETLDRLAQRGVDLAGVARGDGPSFHWSGRYHENLNQRDTLETQLNVLTQFKPELPAAYRQMEYVFLANIDPELQMAALRQLERRKLVACDTMNFWLDSARPALLRLLREIDLLIINDEEARQLSGQHNIVKAARAILRMGPGRLLIKRGEYGVLAFEADSIFAIPAYPLEEVFDPTGAGDTFAGGCLGLIAREGGDLTSPILRRAIAHGSVLASLVVERFGLARLWEVTPADLDARHRAFLRLTDFHTF